MAKKGLGGATASAFVSAGLILRCGCCAGLLAGFFWSLFLFRIVGDSSSCKHQSALPRHRVHYPRLCALQFERPLLAGQCGHPRRPSPQLPWSLFNNRSHAQEFFQRVLASVAARRYDDCCFSDQGGDGNCRALSPWRGAAGGVGLDKSIHKLIATRKPAKRSASPTKIHE